METYFSLLTGKIHWEIEKKKKQTSFTIIILKEMVLYLPRN